jgi:hypothetical protein
LWERKITLRNEPKLRKEFLMKKKPILLVMLMVLLAFSLTFVGCGGDDDDGNGPGGGGFVAVTDITGVPTTATVGVALTLTGTVEPANATNKTIVWRDTVSPVNLQNPQTPNQVGTLKVRALITNGKTESTNYTQDFDIIVGPGAAASNWAAPTSGVTQLTDKTWKTGGIVEKGGYATEWEKEWYSFDVTSGTQYWIWWDDAGAVATTLKGEDIVVSGYYADGKVLLDKVDTAWASAVSFTASESGKVYLLAEPYGKGESDYSIVYSTSASRPSGN